MKVQGARCPIPWAQVIAYSSTAPSWHMNLKRKNLTASLGKENLPGCPAAGRTFEGYKRSRSGAYVIACEPNPGWYGITVMYARL